MLDSQRHERVASEEAPVSSNKLTLISIVQRNRQLVGTKRRTREDSAGRAHLRRA